MALLISWLEHPKRTRSRISKCLDPSSATLSYRADRPLDGKPDRPALNAPSCPSPDRSKAKISCARQFFKELVSSDVKYDVVDSYERLIDIVKAA